MLGILTLVLQIILATIEEPSLIFVASPLLLVYVLEMIRSFALMKRALLNFKLEIMDPILGTLLLQMFFIQKTLEQTLYLFESLV